MGLLDALKNLFGGGKSEPAPAPAPAPAAEPAPAPVVEEAPAPEAPAEAPNPDADLIAAVASLTAKLAAGEITSGQYNAEKSALLKRI